ncbi:spermatogenesis-associated protein 21-like [Orcinus orca]|uniref:spermatogenesis-associated protein 21-like n=1 Tax=Orcinus orca TaxID=9733 RepID=UPI002111D683|nr:spermatogenesis-associated protein 21-like [Orcinus orca]
MHNRNAQMYVECRITAPEAQPSPGLRTASNRAGVEPTISEVSQVVFTDAEGIDSGKQPSSEPGEPEDGPRHREASEEGSPELSTQEQMPPAGPSSHLWPPQEGPGELQAGQDQATPGSELEVLPSRVPAAQERLQQQSSWKETKDQQGSQQNLGTVEGQFPESRQVMSMETWAGGYGMTDPQGRRGSRELLEEMMGGSVYVKANKHQFKQAVKKLYDIDVAKVHTLIRPDGEKKAHDPECQPFPGHLAANEPDIVQPTEPCCTLDSCGQQLGDKPPKGVDTPPIRPQGALPEPGSGGHEDSPQEAMSLMPTATLEEKTAHSSPPSMPRPNTPKER